MKFHIKYQKQLKIIRGIMEEGCPKCKAQPKSWAEFEFHYYTTHGIPRELLIEAMEL